MPRAQKIEYETAAAQQGCGCFIVPPTFVLFFGFILAFASSHISIKQDLTSSVLAPLFTPEIQHWRVDILRWANASSLDPNLIATIMQIESCGDPLARSRAGAAGLFQVMPFHFSTFENPYNPETNAARGLNYLSRALGASNGNVRLAMAGYNGGIGVISRSEWSWSDETKRYVQYGLPIYEDAKRGLSQSAALTDWYDHYGRSLCIQARQNQ